MELIVLAVFLAAGYGARQATRDVRAAYRERRDRWTKEAAARHKPNSPLRKDSGSVAAAPKSASVGIKAGAVAATAFTSGVLIKRGIAAGWREGFAAGRQQALDKATGRALAAETAAKAPAAEVTQPEPETPKPTKTAEPAKTHSLKKTEDPQPAPAEKPLATVTTIPRTATEETPPMTPTRIVVDNLPSFELWLETTARQAHMEKEDAVAGSARVARLAQWLDDIAAALVKLGVDPASIGEIVALRDRHELLAVAHSVHAQAAQDAADSARTTNINVQARHGGIAAAIADAPASAADNAYYNQPAGTRS